MEKAASDDFMAECEGLWIKPINHKTSNPKVGMLETLARVWT